MWIDAGEFESVPNAKADNTHFNAYGATRVCDLAVAKLRAEIPELERWLQTGR
jgi:hypothetical protein